TAAEFTPDGSRVIYLASEDSASTFELFSVSSSGGTPTKISGPLVYGGDVTDFQIAADGKHVVYRADADTDEVFELYSVSLTSSTLQGDFNHNGIVDAADYTIWRDGLGHTFTQVDYTTWKNNFGAHAGSGSSSGSVAEVPESRTAALL